MCKLKKGDKVYIYDNPDLLRWFLMKRNISVYYEITEHPTIAPPRSKIWPISMVKYYSMCKKVDGLFVISNALKDFYTSQGLDKGKVHVINMTVDAERFSGLKKKEISAYFAYCGTISNDKDGVDQLIKAFALFHKKHPEIKLKIIGRIPIGGNKLNEELIKKLDLEKDIILTGQVPPEEMPQLLKNASALVLARPDNLQAKYGFPTKLGEYLLSENPVVVTAVGDIPLFLSDNVSAYIAKPGDIEDISLKLCRVVENPEEAIIVGRKGADVARKYFNNVIEVKKMLAAMNVTCEK